MSQLLPIFYILVFVLSLNFTSCYGRDILNSNAFVNEDVCGKSGYLLVATVDGNLTALDFDSGSRCWTITLDSESFVSSSLSKLEVWENGTQVWLIPSLDGLLFKYDKLKLEPLSFNAESLLSQSAILDHTTSVTGGKFKIVYGINRRSGKVSYKCTVSGCENFNKLSADDALIIEQMVQSVIAVDSLTAEKRWHFRVVEVKIKVVIDSPIKNTSKHHAPFEENALMPIIDCNDLNNLNAVKISLLNGYAGRLNQTSFDFSWIFKTSTPIMDVWYVKDRKVQLVDPFSDESDFYSIDSDDGEHTALLFLGSFMDQLFVKQSKKMKSKIVYKYGISKHTVYQAYCLPLDPKIKHPVLLPGNDSNALMPANANINDHGFYFFVNFSVYDNDTHCIVGFSYPNPSTELKHDKYWLKMISVNLSLLLPILGYMIYRRLHVKKQFANEGTSTLEFSPNHNDVGEADKEKTMEFISRFHKDFQMITILGRGGFGVVMKVKNKIDDCEYAVKRIHIRVGVKYKKLGYGSVMREVKALAKLDHPGIVRYFNSWVENPPKGWQELKDKELDIIDVSRSTTNCEEEDELQSKTKKSQFRSKEKAASNILKRLGVNPLNPFADDFLDFNLEHQVPHNDNKSYGNLSDWSNENSSVRDDSDTLSLNSESKKSVSELSLCYDSEEDSVDSGDFSKTHVLFSPQSHRFFKHIEKLNKQNIMLWKHSADRNRVSDIRTMFNIPEDLFIDKDAVILHLKKINSLLAWRMNRDNLFKLCQIAFYDISCPNSGLTEWCGWTCILGGVKSIQITSTLHQLRIWLISVLCALRLTESHYHNLLYSNFCNILWEVNLLLENDACEVSYDFSWSINTINAFFRLRNINAKLARPMKFIYLIKMRHYLFCKAILNKSKKCDLGSWKSIFYQADAIIFKKNLSMFQVWIISILCDIQLNKLFGFGCLTLNLCNILSEVNATLVDNHVQLVSSEQFFRSFGNLLSQPKNVIKLEENKDNAYLIMFHNSHFPEASNNQNAEDDKPGFLYIQMQLCRKESLRNWLDTHSTSRNYVEVMNMFCQIVDAMDYVHTRGLMHRDLKPSNIYFSMEGLIKIGDFGLATQFEVQEIGDESSSSNSLYYHTRDCGTELYMSPEQRSKKCYNYKTDIFPLGIILYELLVPFGTRSERYKAIYAARDRKFSTDFKTKYPNECMLVRKLLDLEPKQRPTAYEIKNHPLCQPYLQSSRT